MAEMTIFGETLDNNIVDTDFLLYWKTASSVQRRVSRSSLVGATITGGGSIVTNGKTLTVPATGTASLLGTAQIYSALKTFTAGIAFAHETLNYYDEGTWTPTDDSGAGLTLSSPSGRYTRSGRMCFCELSLSYPSTANASSAAIGGLPFTPASLAGSSRGGGWMMTTLYSTASLYVHIAGTSINLVKPGGAALTNADLSAMLVRAAVLFTI
jgi:hypothetical protein